MNKKSKLTGAHIMLKWKCQLLCATIFFIAGCASTRTKNNAQNSFFVQMSDTQFGMFASDSNFVKETVNFEKAVSAANRLHPSFVIVCGDLVNKQNDAAQMAEYKRIAGKLDPSIRLFNVAGNHDVGNRPTPEGLESYRKNFGPDYYSFQSGNVYGIVLNSSLFFDPSLAGEEASRQDAWLRATLKKAAAKKNANIIIFQHIGWFESDPNEKNGYFNIPLERRRAYLDLFHQYGVKYIFAGHLHKNSIGWDNDLEMVITGPVGKPIGKDPSGFRIVTVKGNSISHQYFALDSIPEKVDVPN